MNLIKKITAVVLVMLLALTVIGCHPKNEIAVKIDGHEFSSAYYMCALINAYAEGQTAVSSELTEEEANSGKEIDYFSKKIDGKKFEEWVKNRAIEILKEIAYFKNVCKENKIEITDENRQTSEYYASIIWQSYASLFEPNGVSQATFTQYFVDGASSDITDYAMYITAGLGTPNDYEELCFQHLYGKKGEKKISDKTVKKELYNNYLIADVIEVNFENNESDEERNKIKKQLKDYKKKIESGKMTFEEAYIDYYGEEDHKHEEIKDGPKDPHATVLDATSNYYDDLKKMDTDEVKFIENEYETSYALVVKKDIKSDKYYLKTLDMSIRHTLKDAEFSKATSEAATKLEADVDDFATDRFKVKKIVLPENQ